MQLREPDLDGRAFEFLLRELRARCLAHGAVLLVNSRHGERYWDAADGVHCTAQTAAALTRRPDVAWCAASCHTGDELARAALLGMDFAVIGPVQATESHAGVAPLGWERLCALLERCALPVYALGGLTRADGARAQGCGAHGVAAQRASWEATPAA
jgi:8-oxo-dGTP diphosphatase